MSASLPGLWALKEQRIMVSFVLLVATYHTAIWDDSTLKTLERMPNIRFMDNKR